MTPSTPANSRDRRSAASDPFYLKVQNGLRRYLIHRGPDLRGSSGNCSIGGNQCTRTSFMMQILDELPAVNLAEAVRAGVLRTGAVWFGPVRVTLPADSKTVTIKQL